MAAPIITPRLLEALNAAPGSAPRAVARQLTKFDHLVPIDVEAALVKGRRALDIIIRTTCLAAGLKAGTKPLEGLIAELARTHALPPIIEKHCRLVKDFGNLAAHGGEEVGETSELQLSLLECAQCAGSLNAIADWYLMSIVPRLAAEITYRTVHGRLVNPELLAQCREIDGRVFPAVCITELGVGPRWLERNPDIYTLLLDAGSNQVVGYINAMPLEDAYWSRIEAGELDDVSLPPEAIRTYDLPDMYNLYIASIAVDPPYQAPGAFRWLYEAFLDNLLALARRGVLVRQLLAHAVTSEGERIARFTGMTKVGDTRQGSGIYKATLLPPKVRVTTEKGADLIAHYQARFEKLKDVIEPI